MESAMGEMRREKFGGGEAAKRSSCWRRLTERRREEPPPLFKFLPAGQCVVVGCYNRTPGRPSLLALFPGIIEARQSYDVA